jgi:beta-galactosidase
MDIFRLPKFSRAFFRSQRPPREVLRRAESGPFVFVASWWTPDSSRAVRVFSNCDQVELRLNGETVERRRPDSDRISNDLAHPPFTFQLKRFEPGTLEAIGVLDGRQAARHAVRTPGAVTRLALELDESGRPFGAKGKDVAFVWATLRDEAGTIVPGAWENVSFGATGDLALVGANPFSSDAGVASILVQTGTATPRGSVYALSLVGDGESVRAIDAALAPGGEPEPGEVRFTTDGSAPGPESPLYRGPVAARGRVRAVLLVGGVAIAEADTEQPKFRIAGSKVPAST